ncbi:P-loop NTPase fold protein [Vibrio splendidus]|uniref:P-loop NTPase fold protein n=1 Tax=Vibrio splendidus TaxID=29497 RepID=UPI0003032678|nr:P-loop NTPase fold protein [Vibrio splendidus]OED80564.1 hypothetical protein A144_20770 [Vibrio splendidus ZF-90]OEF21209.1 hypothetical protein A145_05720 [Vibrio splendidus 5S-101]PTP28205.1 hypothetical protein CWN95_22970 [Vibrio splendidus]
MGDYEWGRENGLWGEDGVPYEIADQLSDDYDDQDDFVVRSNNMNSGSTHYSKEVFPGMRESGKVKNTSNYTIAEYEDKGFRLESIAIEVQNLIKNHFVLYDYKGTILTNRSDVIRILHKIYNYDVHVEGDVLAISDTLLTLTSQSHTSDFKDPLENNVASNVQLWHIQLHPDDISWGKETELLEKHALIGLSKSKQEQSFINFERMKVNDIVLVRKGSTPIALVQVNGELEETNDNKDETIDLDWFKYRRKVIVLEYAKNDMDKFPNTRGTLSLAKDTNSLSYRYIIDWYNSLPKTRKNPIKIPNRIFIKEASPSFNVESISKSLSSVIITKPDESGMMVGIFGRWGRGKTYLFNKIWEVIGHSQTPYYRVNFSAWKYQETKESWAYLYENLLNEYLSTPSKPWYIPYFLITTKKLFDLNFNKHKAFPIICFSLVFSFSIYWTFFSGSIELIKIATSAFGLVFLVKAFIFYLTHKNRAINLIKQYTIKPGYSEYLGLQAEIENEIEQLLKVWIPNDNGSRVILFVDDIDRCEPTKIVKLIDGLRIILDNKEIHKRLIVITAVDEEILKTSIEQKYSKLEKKGNESLFHEYIEKVFIIGIKLNNLENNEVKEYMSNLIANSSEKIRKEINSEFSTEQDSNITPEIQKINEKVISPPTNDKHESNENKNDTSKVFDKKVYNVEEVFRDFDISEMEEKELLESIIKLNNPTPRKIKIFYYKYLILKQVFHVRLIENNLIEKWNIESDEKSILEILIHISNKKDLNNYKNSNISSDVLKELKYSANMLSVL